MHWTCQPSATQKVCLLSAFWRKRNSRSDSRQFILFIYMGLTPPTSACVDHAPVQSKAHYKAT